MSDKFNEREKGYEAKFKMDQELQFRARSRRNKLFGLWLADKLGMSAAEAEAYAKTVVVADLDEEGDDDVLRKVKKDIDAHGAEIDDLELRSQLEHFHGEAVRQLENEIPRPL
jgi:hypothetical protein